MQLTIYCDSRDKRTTTTQPVTWPDVVKALTSHDRRTEKEGVGFSPVTFKPGPCTCPDMRGLCPKEEGHALNQNVELVHLLGIDLDKSESGGPLGHEEAKRHLKHIQELGHAAVFHSTHSYAPPEKSTWRVFFALSRPVTGDEFKPFWRSAIAYLRIPTGIKTDFPARFWHAPSCPPDSTPPEASHFEGAPLDVDMLLTSAPGPVIPIVDPAVPSGDHSYPPASDELLAKAAQALQDHGQAIEGDCGDNHTFVAANILLNDYALTYAEAWPMFRAWNSRNEPPWDEGTLKGKLHTNYATEPYGKQRDSWEFIQRLERPPLDGEPGTFAHTLAQARADLAAALDATKATTEVVPMFEEAGAIMARDFPPTPWLVNGLMTAGGIGVLATEPKSAKTWAATEIAIAVATGTPVFGEFKAEQGATAYFYAEDMGQSVRNRLRALLKSRGGTPPPALYCQPRGRDLDVCNDESLAILLASARRIKHLKLLVLDPFRDIHGAAEDSSDEMSKVMRRLRIVGTLLDCTILFVHHSAKAGADTATRRQGQRMRGSSAIHGAIDSGLYFSGLSGNGENEFTNQVLAEVKGARSAGHFNLTLNLVDGADGTAVDANWVITRGVDEDVDGGSDESITEIVECLGHSELRRDRPPKATEMIKRIKGAKGALDRNIVSTEAAGYIEKHLVSGVHRGWVLTKKGKMLFDEINGVGGL